MTRDEFIKFVAEIAVKDWRERRIMLPSIVIAQACKESAFGTSELAIRALAIFGIKLNGWTGKSYLKKADEQNADSSFRVDLSCFWRAYNSWEESIIDHNTYIATRKVGKQTEPNFKAIVGETNVKKVLAGFVGNTNRAKTAERCTDPELKKYVLEGESVYPYATGLNYPQSLLDDYILKYNLTQYDTIEEVRDVVKIAIDAGHGLYTAGKRVTLSNIDPSNTREWSLNDRIADKLEALLRSYECEVLRTDDTTGKRDVALDERVNKANKWGADVFISIHHNAGINGRSGGGTVVYYYSSNPERATQARALYDHITALTGLVGNRSAKVAKYGYYVIKNTKAPAFLIENGFMDSTTDVPVILTEAHANKTARGLLNFLVDKFDLELSEDAPKEEPAEDNSNLYRVQVGAFRNKNNAEKLKSELKSKGYEAIVVKSV